MATVFIINTEHFNLSEHSFLYDYLDKRFTERFKAYTFNRNTQPRFIGELLKRYMICFFTGRRNSSVEITSNEYGKPLLKNSDTCFFNISHSGSYVVGVVDSAPVGIDVEKITAIRRAVAERYFNEREVRGLSKIESEEKFVEKFFFLWTLKEAYIKAIGMGLYKPLSSFCIEQNEGGEVFISDDDRNATKFKQLSSLSLDGRFMLATVSSSLAEYILMTYREFLDALLKCGQFDRVI